MSNVSSSHFKQKLNDLFLQVDAKETKENSLSCSNHNPSKALALLHLPFIEHQEVQAPTIKVPIHDPFSHSDFLHRLHSFKNAPFFFSSCTLNPVDLAAHGWMHLIDMVLVCEVCHHQLILSTALQNLEVLSNADPSSSKLIQHYQTWMNVGHHATCGWLYQPCIERTMKCIVAPNQTKLHMDLRVASFLKVFQDLPVSLGGFEMGTLPYEYTQRYPHVPFVYLMAAHYHWTVMAEASLTYMKCDYCGRCVLPDTFHPSHSHMWYCIYRNITFTSSSTRSSSIQELQEKIHAHLKTTCPQTSHFNKKKIKDSSTLVTP